jgi:hypothetical protein
MKYLRRKTSAAANNGMITTIIPPCSAASFEVNSEPHTGARPTVRLCVGPELARCVHKYVDLKPDRMTKKKIMMAKLLAKNFERFGHTITLQRRRGALSKVAQGGGQRLVHVSPICTLSKTAPVSLT